MKKRVFMASLIFQGVLVYDCNSDPLYDIAHDIRGANLLNFVFLVKKINIFPSSDLLCLNAIK